MEIKSSLKKLLTCGAVLSGLLGIGAVGTNAEGIQAHASIPAGFMRAMEKNDKSTASDSSHAAKVASRRGDERADKLGLTHKGESIKAWARQINGKSPKVAKKPVRHHVKRHAQYLGAKDYVPSWVVKDANHDAKYTDGDSSKAAKKATAQIQKRDSGHISNRAYWHNIHNFEKSIWGNKHHIIKRHTRKHVRKHHNYNHGHNALADIKGSIKYDKNHIRHDKRILSRKHVRKSTKYRARKNLKYSYQSLKKMYSFLK